MRKATLANVIITPLTISVKNAGTRSSRAQRNDFAARTARRLGEAENREGEQQAGNADDVEDGAPAKPLADEAADGLARGAADEHAGGEDGLGARAILLGIAAGNHGLRGGRVGRFADADEGAREQQHREGVNVAGENGGEAPEDDAAGDDARAIEAIGEKSERNAGKRENGLQDDLQIADLRAGEGELIAYQRNQRRDGLAVGKVDEVDQSKYSKQTDLIGRKRDALE